MPLFVVSNQTASDAVITAGNFSKTFQKNAGIIQTIVDDVDQPAFIAACVAAGLIVSPGGSASGGNEGAIAEAVLRIQTLPVPGNNFGVGAIANAIQGDAASKGVTWQEATTLPAERVRAFVHPTLPYVVTQSADARGGNAMAGRQDVALTKVLAGATDGWGCTNLNRGGTAAGRIAEFPVFVEPLHLVAGFYTAYLTFAALGAIMFCFRAGKLVVVTDTVALDPADKRRVIVSFSGGATPCAAGDLVVVMAIG